MTSEKIPRPLMGSCRLIRAERLAGSHVSGKVYMMLAVKFVICFLPLTSDLAGCISRVRGR